MKKTVIALAFLVLSCNSQDPKNSSTTFDETLEAYYQENLSLYRLKGTFQGDTRYNDTLPNYLSDAFQKKEKAFYTSFLNQMKAFDDTSLFERHGVSKRPNAHRSNVGLSTYSWTIGQWGRCTTF
jgi:YesN/AraC family two-component response regulator